MCPQCRYIIAIRVPRTTEVFPVVILYNGSSTHEHYSCSHNMPQLFQLENGPCIHVLQPVKPRGVTLAQAVALEVLQAAAGAPCMVV